MAERDPEAIKKDIDQAREQLATTVDRIAERANPKEFADRAKAKAIEFVTQPAVLVVLAGINVVGVRLMIRRIRHR